MQEEGRKLIITFLFLVFKAGLFKVNFQIERVNVKDDSNWIHQGILTWHRAEAVRFQSNVNSHEDFIEFTFNRWFLEDYELER